MEPFGGLGVLMNLGNENTGSEILKSLLTSSKMQKIEPVEVNILPDLESSTQTEEQIVFQIELGQPIKSEFMSSNEDIIQHVPVTYVMANNQNLIPANNETLVEPVSYVLNRDLLPTTTGYCTVATSEPQKIILVQEVDSNGPQTVYNSESKENQMNEGSYPDTWSMNWGVESHIVSDIKCESNGKGDEKSKKNLKKGKSENLKEYQAKKGEEESSESKAKVKKKNDNGAEIFNELYADTLSVCPGDFEVNIGDSESDGLSGDGDESDIIPPERQKEMLQDLTVKVSASGKSLKKKKNSKLKSKLKTGGKALVKKAKKEFDGERKEEEKVKKKKNLFELTKLEENVDQVAERLKIGCDCSESNCFDGLNPHDVFKHRLNIADLTKAEHDMFLMGVIMASFHNLEETTRHKERIRIRSYYAYKGKKVCLTAFLYLQHVTLYQMKSLRNHLKKHGVSPKIHGNRGRKPANTFSLDIYRRAANFVQNYIEDHCVKTVPSMTLFSSDKVGSNSINGTHDHKTNAKKNKQKIGSKMTLYHLPPECTKRFVHGEYKTFCENLKPSQKVMKYSTFTSFLKKQFPNVKFHKRDDKKQEKVVVKLEETEKWKTNGRVAMEKRENMDKKLKEDQGVDKSIQVDKTLVYIPAKTQVLINGQRLDLYDESGASQPSYEVGNQVLVASHSRSVNQSQNSEQYYAIDSTV